MKNMNINVKLLLAGCMAFCGVLFSGCTANEPSGQKLPVKVLILPKFETGEMSGDFAGEAQHFYEEYLAEGEEYTLENSSGDAKLYWKDGIALCVLGEGKVSAALNMAAVLSDDRFDFSNTYIISTGCAGAAKDYGTMGDVYIITATVDFDLGHHADARELSHEDGLTWFHDEEFDPYAIVLLDSKLTNDAYELVKDIELDTTPEAKAFLQDSFPGAEWANRSPKALKGTSVTSDDFWKGFHDHRNALLVTETYGCPDPFAASEMEDMAVARTAESFGMLDRLIILRYSVNLDVFFPGMTPERLWYESIDNIAAESSTESINIFPIATENNFKVGKVLIEAILNGELGS